MGLAGPEGRRARRSGEAARNGKRVVRAPARTGPAWLAGGTGPEECRANRSRPGAAETPEVSRILV